MPQDAPVAPAESKFQATGFRPVADSESTFAGTFAGTVWLHAPAGDVVGVDVSARVGRSADGQSGGWELYFFDATRTLSADGQLALKSGTAHWLTRDDDRAFLQTELVSLGRDVLQSPGWSLLQHPLTGEVKGEAWLRIPSSGADLAPLKLTFFLHRSPLAGCDAGCTAGTSCDPLTGFCAVSAFAPGEFRGDLELLAVHKSFAAWSHGPEVPSSLNAANIWCANDAIGFAGQWASPSMGTMAQAVMPRSGDLYCIDPTHPLLGVRARGPIPLANRADLEERGVLQRIDPDRLARVCSAELDRREPLGFASRFGETSNSFDAFRDGYLNYEADCVSMGHFSALVHLAQAGTFSRDLQSDQLSRRTMARLLQQWIELHTFVANNDSALSTEQRLLRMETGWAAVLQLLGSSALQYLIDPAQPDYRQGIRFGLCRSGCGDPALRCESGEESCTGGVCRPKQCVLNVQRTLGQGPGRGLAATIMDGLAGHMNLVKEHVQKAEGDATTMYGQSVRYGLLLDTLTHKLVALGTRCESPSVNGCAAPSWLPAFQEARDRYTAARGAAWKAVKQAKLGAPRQTTDLTRLPKPPLAASRRD